MDWIIESSIPFLFQRFIYPFSLILSPFRLAQIAQKCAWFHSEGVGKEAEAEEEEEAEEIQNESPNSNKHFKFLLWSGLLSDVPPLPVYPPY